MPNTIRTDNKTKHKAVALRHKMTPAETKLWRYLRNDQMGVSFRRQHAIGPFIADFCCIKTKLVIELDGGHHLEQEMYDSDRTEYLRSRGYKVVRFWNNEVMNDIEGVIMKIQESLSPL